VSFARAVAYVLQAEGGLVDNPKDPGGLTAYGISQRAYPNEDIANMTPERAAQLYSADYWDPIRGDQLPDPLGVALLDFAVNSGVPTAIRAFQRALRVTPDGIMGPATIAAALRSIPRVAITSLSAERMALLTALPTWPDFGRGWTQRVVNTAIEALLS
jgi:lysozyme family protein